MWGFFSGIWMIPVVWIFNLVPLFSCPFQSVMFALCTSSGSPHTQTVDFLRSKYSEGSSSNSLSSLKEQSSETAEIIKLPVCSVTLRWCLASLSCVLIRLYDVSWSQFRYLKHIQVRALQHYQQIHFGLECKYCSTNNCVWMRKT